MSDIILYDYWRSSAAYRVRIALGLKGLAWRAVPIDLLRRDQRAPEHLARNPQGLVPVLEIDGRLLTQSLAIIEYLEETRPTPSLLPADAAGRARVRALADLIAMEIHPVNMLSVLDHVESLTGGGSAERVAWMQHFMPPGLSAFEAMLARDGTGRFCHGDAPGLADICLIPQIYNAERWGIELSGLPAVTRIVAACRDLAAFREAHPDAVGPPGRAT